MINRKKTILALIAGIALYQLIGLRVEDVQPVVDCLVLAELVARLMTSDHN
jgi:hypothetical protein